MKEINIDFETFSEVDLKVAGAHRYMEDLSTEILWVGWSIDGAPAEIWSPLLDDNRPKDLMDALNDPEVIIRAFNATFEYLVIRHLGHQIGITPQPRERFHCTQARAIFYGWPQSLEAVGDAMGLGADHLKSKEGKKLIQKFCKPKKYYKSTPFTRWTPENAPEEFSSFGEYCRQDVVAEQTISINLPKSFLPEGEQKQWVHTLLQNDRGIFIDVPLVKAILNVLDEWKTSEEQRLSDWTNGEVTTGNQRQRILDFCEGRGYPLDGLTKADVDKALDDPDSPEEVKTMMEYRQRLSMTSTGKYKKMMQSICRSGAVKGNLFWHGALTGRYGARGLQIQNFPRAYSERMEELIEAFKSGLPALSDFEYSPMILAKQLLRSTMIPPPGYDWYVADYSSVENRIIHWLAGDEETLQEFREGLDQYKTFARDAYHVPYGEVTDTQRHRSKTIILGMQFMMGAKTYIEVAKGYGLSLTEAEAKGDLGLYKNKYPLVENLWWGLHDAALSCVKWGNITNYGKIWFKMIEGTLYMRLPSGRSIKYNRAEVRPTRMPWGQMKDAITFEGINPYNRKWMRLTISPGRLTENAVQGSAADVLLQGALNAEDEEFKVVGSVHDEPLTVVPEGSKDISDLERLICEMPNWAKGLPLAAEGWVGKRYKKA